MSVLEMIVKGIISGVIIQSGVVLQNGHARTSSRAPVCHFSALPTGVSRPPHLSVLVIGYSSLTTVGMEVWLGPKRCF